MMFRFGSSNIDPASMGAITEKTIFLTKWMALRRKLKIAIDFKMDIICMC